MIPFIFRSTNGCSVDLTYFSVGNIDTINFSVATTGVAPFTYSWDFGDSSFSTSANPYHVFNTTQQDTFYVCVTVIDSNGCTATDCDWIAAPDICGVPATFTYQVQNDTVSFYSTASLLGAPIPFTYAWDFGDGNTSAGDNPVHSYIVSGNYLVSLTVTDGITGCSNTFYSYVSIQVGGVGYTCSADYAYQIDSIGNVYFNSVATGIAPYTYAWDFGNGNTSNQANPYYSYSTTGYYSPCLTVTDASGCTSTYCDTVYVQISSGNCFADFYHQSFSNVDSTTVNFGANVYSNPYGYIYAWTFGNGNTSIAPFPTQTYTSTGYYQICLTVIDSTNCTSTFCDSNLYSSTNECL